MADQLSHFRSQLRSQDAGEPYWMLASISKLRSATQASRFRDLLSTIPIAAPRHRKIFERAPSHFRDLLFFGSPKPLTLERELKWAEGWFSHAVTSLNRFVQARERCQIDLIADRYSSVTCTVDDLTNSCGWSWWATELRLLVRKLSDSSEAAKSELVTLAQMHEYRASKLVAYVLSDRLDDSLSHAAFSAKVLDAASRYRDPWIRAYFPFRALRQLPQTQDECAIVLATDWYSSIFDYYETFIQIVAHVPYEDRLVGLQRSAHSALTNLQRAGLCDQRIASILQALEPFSTSSMHKRTTVDSVALMRHRFISFGKSMAPAQMSNFESGIYQHISAAEMLGRASPDDVETLLRLSNNAHSLDLGRSIRSKVDQCIDTGPTSPLVPHGAEMMPGDFAIEDVLLRKPEEIPSILQSIAEGAHGSNQSIAAAALAALAGSAPSDDPFLSTDPSLLHVWVIRKLVEDGDYVNAERLIHWIETSGPAWSRYAKNLRIFLLLNSGNIHDALRECGATIGADKRLASDLPLSMLLGDCDWPNFSDLPPPLVAVVAHSSNILKPSSGARFLCRMACREFYRQGGLENLSTLWEGSDAQDKLVLGFFLNDVWVSDNLSLVDKFASSQEIRPLRLRILQFLLSVDSKRERQYSDAIRQLTLDEALSEGLKELHRTKLFVNEAAITRWAEKEIQGDYDRWRILQVTTGAKLLADEAIRKYLATADIEELTRSLPKEINTEANTVLLGMLDRVLKKFVLDPNYGLDSYLSGRIRHGTLEHTLLGPLEEESLLIHGDSARSAFVDKWAPRLRTNEEELARIGDAIAVTSDKIVRRVRSINEDIIQVNRTQKPKGAFMSAFDPKAVPLLVAFFSAPMTFSQFLVGAFQTFWSGIKPSRLLLSSMFRTEVKTAIQGDLDRLISDLTTLSSRSPAIQSALRTAATQMQARCELVADWFEEPGASAARSYSLLEAIEVATRATKNVYRQFNCRIDSEVLETESARLSSVALASVCDCLFVMFENAWKHSGLGSQLESINLQVEFSSTPLQMRLRLTNALSAERQVALENGELLEIRRRVEEGRSRGLAAMERGSGLAKLERMSVNLGVSINCGGLKFGLCQNKHWFVEVLLPVYERDGEYDAFTE